MCVIYGYAYTTGLLIFKIHDLVDFSSRDLLPYYWPIYSELFFFAEGLPTI